MEWLDAKWCSHTHFPCDLVFYSLSDCPKHEHKCACKGSYSITALSKQSEATQMAATTKTAHRIYYLKPCIGALVFRDYRCKGCRFSSFFWGKQNFLSLEGCDCQLDVSDLSAPPYHTGQFLETNLLHKHGMLSTSSASLESPGRYGAQKCSNKEKVMLSGQEQGGARRPRLGAELGQEPHWGDRGRVHSRTQV